MGDQGQTLFRQQALAGLGASRRLDTAVPVTSSRLWTLLDFAAAVIAAILVWAVFGTAPQRVSGSGILLPPEGLYEVGVGPEGIVTEVTVDEDDIVTAGEDVVVLTDIRGVAQTATRPMQGMR